MADRLHFLAGVSRGAFIQHLATKPNVVAAYLRSLVEGVRE